MEAETFWENDLGKIKNKEKTRSKDLFLPVKDDKCERMLMFFIFVMFNITFLRPLIKINARKKCISFKGMKYPGQVQFINEIHCLPVNFSSSYNERLFLSRFFCF